MLYQKQTLTFTPATPAPTVRPPQGGEIDFNQLMRRLHANASAQRQPVVVRLGRCQHVIRPS